jgi:CheY-like chemotaxis protein
MFTLDLLVTDVVMQEFDVVELLRRIRHDGNEADLPILAITGTLTPEFQEHLLPCSGLVRMQPRRSP